jgi:hypothetical protein
MKNLINMFRKPAVTTLKAKNPKNQALLEQALATLNKKESKVDIMVWKSNVKQILQSKDVI